ncbi:FxsA family protein [Acidimangrovimonas sediminis]|uniref:FxsA family protein n=1 Tax=Acidimangrovimonas sediminis TaxID=2056283 RepID=UPI000C802E9F|nr:FxsA family protein [Acidimangrovimonas sediminis]
MWLFALFIVVPLIEITLFIKIGGWLTLWPTLAIVVGSAVLGTWLVRQQGAQALADLRRSMQELTDPTEPLAHGALILLAGALLITPGFLTDTIGILLLIPPVRRALMRWVGRHARVQRVQMGGQAGGFGPDFGPGPRHGAGPRDGDDTVIDGDFTEVDPSKKPTHQPSGWTRH